MMKLNESQVQASARANMKGAAKRVAICFDLVKMYKEANMMNDSEFLFNARIIATILEGFIYGDCYPTFDGEFELELTKVGLSIVFGSEGCGYITDDNESLIVYFG